MSYYNTQNNPQQNPAVQANSPHNRQVQQSSTGGSQGSFSNWMRPQRQARPPVQKNSSSETTSTRPQQQQQQEGWQPRSPVNANGTISTNPISFSSSYTPPPAVTVKRTQSGSGGTSPDPQWASLRTQQNASNGPVPEQYKAVSDTYRTNLGRPGSMPEWQNWANNPNFASAIQNSPEAQAFKQQQAQVPQAAPNPFGHLPEYNPMATPGFVDYNSMDYGGIQTPGMYAVNRPGAYNYEGGLDEGLNPFSPGTQDAFNRLSTMPLGLPVERMKAAQAETAEEMYQGNAAQSAQRAAASGTINGGMAERQRQQMMADRNKDILTSYRDIDIEDSYAQRDNAQQIATTGNTLADSFASRSKFDEDARYNDAESNQTADINFQDFLAGQYRDGLDGSKFELDRLAEQDDSNRFAADYGQQTWDTLNDNYFKSRSQNLTDMLGTEGMAMDWDKFGEQKGQNRFGNMMDLVKFMEDQRQFNSNFGLDKGKLKLDSRNSAMKAALDRRNQDINLLDFFGEG